MEPLSSVSDQFAFNIWGADFESLIYSRTTVNKRQNSLKVVVHVIIIDQYYQTTR